MRRPSVRGRVTFVTAVIVGAAMVVPAAGAVTSVRRPQVNSDRVLARSLARLDPSLRHARGPVQVMLQLSDAPAVTAYAGLRAHSEHAAVTAFRSRSAQIKRIEAGIVGDLAKPATRATELYAVHAVYAGVAVRTDASRLGALARLPGVRAVHRIVPKTVDNTVTVPLIGAPQAWGSNGGDTGSGVTIGIIDTGIDYTHADFGGPGTVSAYNAAKATDTAPPTYPDPAKVAGGVDLAGDAYDSGADSAAAQTPHPDANPLDCDGHGTHVAGTAAGFGVLKDGSTYTGTYGPSLDESQFHVGPGVAPQATLYAIKIFGCSGSTGLVTEGLDWAADPNGDGNPDDHLDVVNLSVGGDFTSAEDPDAVAANAASLLGMTVVSSAGNAGDQVGVVGSPANATRAIAVAASDDTQDVVDGLVVTSPASLAAASPYPAEQSSEYDWATKPGVTNAPLARIGNWTSESTVDATNADGCEPLSATQAAAVAGKVAFLWWTDNDVTRRCTSADRAANVKKAGAIGALYGDDQDTFSAMILGDPDIPVMLTTKTTRDAIVAQLNSGTTVDVTMTNAEHNQVVQAHPATVDQLVGFSSRGGASPEGIKPDITAPGMTVFSAAMGTGSDGISYSGTSMASPHVAGAAALVKQAHPTWTPEQIKAALMNTAGQDVFSGTGHTGHVFAPARAGAGRVEVDRAVSTPALAYNTTDHGAVSVSFGTLSLLSTTTLSKFITVKNVTTNTLTYAVSYQGIDVMPGASYTVSPSSLTLAPGATGTVRITLTVVPSQLVDRPDPTIDLTPQSAIGDNETAQFLADASGRVVLGPTGSTGGGPLRVPVYAAPRPASAMTARTVAVGGRGSVRTGTLSLTGRSIVPGAPPTSRDSLEAPTVDAFELQGTSPAQPSCSTSAATQCVAFPEDRAGDLAAVGFASDAPAYAAAGLNPYAAQADAHGDYGEAQFAIAVHGPWQVPATYEEYDVFIDVNRDGRPDIDLFNTQVVGSDLFYAEADRLDSSGNDVGVLDIEHINNVDGSVDTQLFNSDVMTLPIALSALKAAGLDTRTTASSRINYFVDAATGESGITDWIGDPAFGQRPMSADVASPQLSATDTDTGNCIRGPRGYACPNVLILDTPGVTLRVRNDTANHADRALGLLLLHHDNVTGKRVQVVRVVQRTATRLSLNHKRVPYRAKVTATVHVAPAAAPGRVTLRVGSRVLGHASVHHGLATIRFRLKSGTYRLRASYAGNTTYLSSRSATVRLTVRKRTRR